MRKILGSLLVVYTVTVCFGDAYKLHTWVPVPLAVLLLGLVVAGWSVLLTPRVPVDRGFFRTFDLFLVAYVLDLGVSLLLSGSIEPTNVHHLIAYATVVGLYYFFVKFLFAADGVYDTYEVRIRAALALSVVLVSTYAILEFIDNNLAHLGVTAAVRFPTGLDAYQPIFIAFVRARGFMVESGVLALFLNAFVPMSAVYCRARFGTAPMAVFVVLAAVALLLTFSVAGVASAAVGWLLAWGMYVSDRRMVLVPVRSLLILACGLVLLGAIAARIPGEIWSVTLGKLTLVDVTSGQDRVRRWLAAVAVAAQHPLWGTGVGSTSARTGEGLISFYLTMLKEAGVPGLVLVVSFLVAVFRQILALPRDDAYKYAYGASFVAVACHYAVVSDVWYPWLWLLCVFIVARSRRRAALPLMASAAVRDAG
jgi:hypothetical protein